MMMGVIDNALKPQSFIKLLCQFAFGFLFFVTPVFILRSASPKENFSYNSGWGVSKQMFEILALY